MIRQAFKLMWNQRRKHLGLSFEIFFSFLVLFIVFSFGIYNLEKYLSPLGYSYEDVWTISLNREGMEKEKALEIDKLIRQNLTTYSEIDEFCFSDSNVPYGHTSNSSSMERENASVLAQRYRVSDNYRKTLQVEMSEGRWFNQEDDALDASPFILTEDMAKILYPEGSPIGKTLDWGGDDGKPRKIVGVTKNFRFRGGIQEPDHGFFIRQESDRLLSNILLKVNKNATAAFEARMMKNLHQIAPEYSMEIEYIEEMRSDFLLFSIIPMLVLGIIGSFLIFNVALGLFGVLWQNISQRKQEIGVRRAMGSSKAEVTTQFILEIMVLATMSLVLGLFFAIQFPLLDVMEVKSSTYILAMVFAAICIYLLVFVCALIPSSQAAELDPAIALRED